MFKVDVLIDDKPDSCEKTADLGIKVICMDNTYNKHVKESKNIIRANNWVEVYTQILILSNQMKNSA